MKRKNHGIEKPNEVHPDFDADPSEPRAAPTGRAADNVQEPVRDHPGSARRSSRLTKRAQERQEILIPGTRMGYRITEVATMFGVSRDFIYSLIAEEKLRARQFSGRLTMILTCDLEEFLRNSDVFGGRAA